MHLKDNNLYFIGGVVRDNILGVESIDTDLCYEGNAIEYSEKNRLNIIKINPNQLYKESISISCMIIALTMD